MQQRELAKKCLVSEAQISMILSGARRPSWDLAILLGRATGTETQFWMDATPKQKRAALEYAEYYAENKGGDKR